MTQSSSQLKGRKFSQLPVSESSTDTDKIVVIQNGVSVLISIADLLGSLVTTKNVVINDDNRAVNFEVKHTNGTAIFSDGTYGVVGIGTNTPNYSSKLTVGGNLSVTGIVGSSYEITVTNSINVSKETSLLNGSASLNSFNLPVGFDGQTKHIVWGSTDGSISAVYINCSALVGSPSQAKITLNAVGQGVTLKYVPLISSWVCVGVNNHSAATGVEFSP